jgi:hypothetical protein
LRFAVLVHRLHNRLAANELSAYNILRLETPWIAGWSFRRGIAST